MLGKEIIMQELTVIDLDVNNYVQVFEIMGNLFYKKRYVNDTYLPSIKERELKYPTALPVKPCPVAIPHTEPSSIIKPFIAPVRLKKSVPWGDMSDPENKFDVKLVCLLGFKEPGEHIELLQILMYNFQKYEWINSLFKAKTTDEFYKAFLAMEWRHD